MATIAFVIPALNEAAQIEHVIATIPRLHLEAGGHEVQIMVVDGHSTDGTLEIAQRAGARVLRQSGRGKGQAIREAFHRIRSDYVFVLDGDGTYPGSAAPSFLDSLEAGADIVMGRRVWLSTGQNGWIQLIGNQFLTRSANILFGTQVRDLCTGMWAFQGHVTRDLVLRANGFDIEANILAWCARTGYEIQEVPIPYVPRDSGSKLRPVRDGTRIFARLLIEAIRDRSHT